MGSSEKITFYVGDFETTGKVNTGMRVWLWGLTDRHTTMFKWGEDLNSFIETVSNLEEDRPLIYFHNLRFDGSYLLVSFLSQGYTHVEQITDDNQISTVITDTGLFYEIAFSKNGKIIKFHDSVKKIPLSLAQIPKAYGLDLEKLDLDYNKEIGPDYIVTEEDIAYQKHDVFIVAQALDIQYSEGLTKMTSSADAMEDYKQRIGKNKFSKLYPVLQPKVDEFCRKSYKGGITYVKPSVAGKQLGRGIVYDIHSMYPAQMKYHLLPYGKPIYFKGDIQEGLLSKYPLYIVKFTADFTLKPDHMPMVQLKNTFGFNPTEYVETSDGEVEMTMTSVDFEVFKKQYEIYYLEVHGAFYFNGAHGLFDSFIDHWYKVKSDPKSTKGIVTISKLKLNGLYGKFGTNPKNVIKEPYLDENGVLRFSTVEKEDRPSVYVPMASFITAYARKQIVETAQATWEWFCYCDTDSVHLSNIPKDEDMSNYLEITESELGTWGVDNTFERAVFYRAKTYKQDVEGETMVKCAGLSHKAVESVKYDEFEMGVVFEQLKSRQVKGGVELYLAPFELK